MNQDVNFLGLSSSPSDNACQDGELATCHNIINEDGSLKPISKPVVKEAFTLPEGAKIVYVHKVTHNNEIHEHYIIRYRDNSFYWVEKGGTDIKNLNLVSKCSQVTSVGNFLCFVSNTETKYILWYENKYKLFSLSDFSYTFEITNTKGHEFGEDKIIVELGDDFDNCFNVSLFGTNYIVSHVREGAALNIFSAIDSKIEEYKINYGKYYFKYICFGVIAIKLYDGNYYRISDVFMLLPKDGIYNTIYYHLNEYKDYKKCITSKAFIHRHQIKINILDNSILDLVDSIDVFLTNEETFFDLTKTYTTVGTSDFKQDGYFNIDFLTDKKLREKFDSLVFYHSIKIDKTKFGEKIDLVNVSGTELSLSLSDMLRNEYGGTFSCTYNNRLHIANPYTIIKSITDFMPKYEYLMTYKSRGGGGFDNPYSDVYTILGNYLDLPTNEKSWYIINNNYGREVEAIIIIDNKYYYHGRIQYPMPPLFLLPILNITECEIYLKIEDFGNKIYYQKFKLYQSNNIGISYTIFRDEKLQFKYNQVRNVSDVDDKLQFSTNPEWEEKDNSEWEEKLKLCADGGYSIYNQNTIKVSESENPIVFPARNTVQVGSSKIQALSANTRPITEGQFGEAPLYVFTDEGVWALMTSTEGLYEARQPVSREICSNPNAILQADNCVLFHTDHGIMMQQGSDAECITDQIDDYPFDFNTLPYGEQLAGDAKDKVRYIKLRDYIKSSNMIYDYSNSRIIVFNPNYKYAYVYSLKSKMWATMDNDFASRVNTYPNSLAVTNSGQIVDVYDGSPTKDVPYIMCSRPFTLGQNDVYKTMFSCLTRGYMRQGKGKCGMVLYGSNDLFHWFLIDSSVDRNLRGMAGSPYKYFRIAMLGSLSPDESINGISTYFMPRWQNKIR